jgi:hypothetical protein
MQRETFHEDDQVDLKNAEFYRSWTRKIMRQWRAGLSGSELHVLLFITDRTLGWGKQWERITRKHFQEGVHSRDGEMVAAPVPIVGRTLDTALKRMEEDGIILVRDGNNRTLYYSLNYEMETNDDNTPKRGMRRPKQKNSPQKLRNDTAEITVSSPQKLRINIYKDNKTKDKLVLSEQELHREGNTEDIKEEEVNATGIKNDLVRGATQHRDNKRSRLRSKRIDGVYTASAIRSLWEQHSGGVTITEMNVTALRAYNRRWKKASSNDERDFFEFLAFVLPRWTTIVSYWLHWMKRSPKNPSPLFFIKWCSHFEEAYIKDVLVDQLADMTRFERLVHRFVEDDGMSQAAARAHVCKKYGLQDDTDSNRNKTKTIMPDTTQHTPTGDAMRTQRKATRTRRSTSTSSNKPFGSFNDE